VRGERRKGFLRLLGLVCEGRKASGDRIWEKEKEKRAGFGKNRRIGEEDKEDARRDTGVAWWCLFCGCASTPC